MYTIDTIQLYIIYFNKSCIDCKSFDSVFDIFHIFYDLIRCQKNIL